MVVGVWAGEGCGQEALWGSVQSSQGSQASFISGSSRDLFYIHLLSYARFVHYKEVKKAGYREQVAIDGGKAAGLSGHWAA